MPEMTQEQIDEMTAQVSRNAAAAATKAAQAEMAKVREEAESAATEAAAKARSEAEAAAAEAVKAAEDKAADEERKRLEAEGKTDEAARLAAERATAESKAAIEAANSRIAAAEAVAREATQGLTAVQQQNAEMARDRAIDTAFGEVEFAGGAAKQYAVDRFRDMLSQGDDGSWQAAEGKSVADAAAEFTAAEDNSFLFKLKGPNGVREPEGQTNVNTTQTDVKLTDMDENTVVENAAALTADDGNNWD